MGNATTTSNGIVARDLLNPEYAEDATLRKTKSMFALYCYRNAIVATKRQAAKWLRENSAIVSNL